MGQKYSYDRITPEMAATLLSTSTNNRPISKQHVRSIASDMIRNKFMDNGASIVISDDGKLLDGQHRLSAVILSGVPHYFHIVRGISPDAILSMDQVRVRNLRDHLYIKEMDGAIAPSVSILHIYRKSLGSSLKFRKDKATRIELYELFECERGIQESVQHRKVGKKMGLHALWPFAHYILSKHDREDADLVMDYLSSGNGFNERSPICIFREQAFTHIRQGKKRSNHEVCWRLFYSWNHFRNGTVVSTINLNPESPIPVPI